MYHIRDMPVSRPWLCKRKLCQYPIMKSWRVEATKGKSFQKEAERHSNLIADVIDMTGIRILRVSTSFYGFFLLAILLYQNILVSAKKRLGLLDNDYEVSSRGGVRLLHFSCWVWSYVSVPTANQKCVLVSPETLVSHCSNAIHHWKNSHWILNDMSDWMAVIYL